MVMREAKAGWTQRNCSIYKQQSVSMKEEGSPWGLKSPTKQEKMVYRYGISDLLGILCERQYWLHHWGGHWPLRYRRRVFILPDVAHAVPFASTQWMNEWMDFSFIYYKGSEFSGTTRPRKLCSCNCSEVSFIPAASLSQNLYSSFKSRGWENNKQISLFNASLLYFKEL